MAKKRKAGSSAPKARKEEDSKLAISTYEDVADSEDEFHMNRDKVLLDEGPAAKRLRKWQEEDKFLQPSDEEVLDAGSDDDDEEEYDLDGAESGSESEDEISGQRKPAEEEDEDVGAWGASKKDYYNADAIETEQDALDEEAEARRIQKKQLQAMTEADFGFDEEEWLGQDGDKDAEGGAVVTEVLPQLQITDSMSENERMKIMRTRYPEFEHISREYLRLQPLHDELAATANAAERLLKAQAAKSGKANGKTTAAPIAVTKYRACAAYLAAMAMYFAVLGSTATNDGSPVIAMDPAELHEHPVMESLLKCQKMWTRIESLPIADPMVETTNEDDLSIVEEASDAEIDNDLAVKKPTRQKKSKAQRATEIAQAEAAARRAAKLAKAEQDLASLDTLTDKAALKKAARKKKAAEPKINLLNPDDSDFGEETELTAHEAAEKAKKKRSLRFYTSQIAQKANKRDAAGKDYGGDADIPHRERLKDRQARLQAEAEKRAQHDKGPGAALGEDDDASSADEGPAPNREDFEDEDGYYDMVAARADTKKQTKLDRAAAYALAAKEGAQVIEEEVIGDDGRRMISYQIQKNKGLTPHRKKSVRNPRVKKKEKYKEKQKKLKSMKPVFDRGAAAKGSANYGGELTGIKSGLVRSRKL
jgi:U3 small nucleolar RNA-associated protein 3